MHSVFSILHLKPEKISNIIRPTFNFSDKRGIIFYNVNSLLLIIPYKISLLLLMANIADLAVNFGITSSAAMRRQSVETFED
jgi:hypothetical protein